MLSSLLTPVLAGFGLGLSLILPIGAQNAFVLRQGLRREHVAVIVMICALSDALLITLGIAGLGAIIQQANGLLTVARIGGAAFLTWYAVSSARRALRPGDLVAEPEGAPMSRGAVVATVLSLTWLNPHVYLDTVVLLGSVGASYHGMRWWFAAGAVLASIVWFTVLGFGSRWLRPLFAKPASWRILDLVIAAVMLTIAISLLVVDGTDGH